MAHYIDADTLRVKITDLCANANFHQQKAIEESDREDFVSSGGEIYAYAKVLSLLDSLQQEQPVEGLEKELNQWRHDHFKGKRDDFHSGEYLERESQLDLARHFAEWGARHSINWGDVQLLDTFIFELSREEKDGTDWGDSEKFYTEVLRRFHEFNDKKISEIVAEWGKAHARKEE